MAAVGGDIPLLEREEEMTLLGRFLSNAREGGGGGLLVEGPAGIGKTEILRAMGAEGRRQGFDVLTARGGELDYGLSWGIVRQLFEPRLRRIHGEERVAVLDGAATLSLSVLGAEVVDELRGPEYQALHGLYWLCANLSERVPILLIVDDAHWADAASGRFFDYLFRRIAELPVTVMFAARPYEPEASHAWLERLRDHQQLQTIRPRPLGEEATARLIRDELGRAPEPIFTRACRASTGGNPFLLVELIKALVADAVLPTAEHAAFVATLGPESVTRHVLVRLSGVSADALRVAQAVAVMERVDHLRQVGALLDIDERTAADAVDLLVKTDILRPGRPLEFVHPMMRAAVYNELPLGARAAAHRHVARILEADGYPAEEIAVHLVLAEPANDPWVVDILRAAARRAGGTPAGRSAVRYLRRALVEPPSGVVRRDVLHELGRVEDAGSDEAIGSLHEALTLTSDPVQRAAVAADLAQQLADARRWTDAIEVLDTAIEELGDRDAEIRLRLEAQLLHALDLSRIPGERLEASYARIEELTAGLTGETAAERLMLASETRRQLMLASSADSVAALAARALGDGALLRDEGPDLLWFRTNACLMNAGRPDEARANFIAGQEEARARGSEVGFVFSSIGLGWTNVYRGALSEAEADLRAAYSVASRFGSMFWGLPMSVGVLLSTLAERGLLDAADLVLAESGLTDALDDLAWHHVLHGRGALRAARGDFAGAAEDLLHVGKVSDAQGVRNPVACPWRTEVAPALVSLGELKQAGQLAEQEVERAAAFGEPRALAGALRVAAMVAGGERGLEMLREAVHVLEPTGADLVRAYVLHDLGAALRRSNQRAASREPLGRALDLAVRCGADPLAVDTEQELKATGARPRRRRLTGMASLTASETRVARMAAEGMTNRGIAQALFVTTKTIESHLAHAYQKLQIRSRSELADALGARVSR